MKYIIRSAIVALAVTLLLLLPSGYVGHRIPTAFAASGATFRTPPNHNLEAGPLQLGAVPTNYNFSNGSANWNLVAGNLNVSGGEATLTGSSGAVLRSASYTLASGVKSVKIRYKVGASASVSVKNNSSGTAYGTDNLSCISCTTGDWVDKYIAVTGAGWGLSVYVEFAQSSGTTVIDEAGTQWIPFQQWDGPYSGGTSLGVNSQPRQDGSQIMEVRGSIFTSDFQLTENRLEFDYAFPLASGNSLTGQLYKASNDALLSSESLTGSGVGWTRTIWTWGTNYVGETVYVKFSSASSHPSWIDNVGVNFMDTSSRADSKSAIAGDPFDTTTGEFIHSHADISVPGRGLPLEFTRTY